MNFMKKKIKANMQAEMKNTLAVVTKWGMANFKKKLKRLKFKVKPFLLPKFYVNSEI